MTAPEFSRPHRLDQIGAGENTVSIAAGEGERQALAKRFGLVSIDRLEARYTLRREAAGVLARGTVVAEVVQACVVTDDPLPAQVVEDFTIRFLPEPEESEEEIELSADECDTVFYGGATIDLGEAAAETLALALEPFPRSEHAAAVLREAGVLNEEEAGPFGALASLKERLKGQQG